MVNDAEHATEVLRRTLAGAGWAGCKMCSALNAAAAIYAGGRATSLKEGVTRARETPAAGRALEVVERMRRASHGETS